MTLPVQEKNFSVTLTGTGKIPLVHLFFHIYRQICGIHGLKNKISPLRSALKGVILIYDNIIG